MQAQVSFTLKISGDKRYLIDQNNKPFPILGRTAWFIISQPEDGYKKFIENTISRLDERACCQWNKKNRGLWSMGGKPI
jgi:hypothetical protein